MHHGWERAIGRGQIMFLELVPNPIAHNCNKTCSNQTMHEIQDETLHGVLFILQVVLYSIFVTSSEFQRDDTAGMTSLL